VDGLPGDCFHIGLGEDGPRLSLHPLVLLVGQVEIPLSDVNPALATPILFAGIRDDLLRSLNNALEFAGGEIESVRVALHREFEVCAGGNLGCSQCDPGDTRYSYQGPATMAKHVFSGADRARC